VVGAAAPDRHGHGVKGGFSYVLLGAMYLVSGISGSNRRFDWRRIYPMLIETASLTGGVMLLAALAVVAAIPWLSIGFL
jgi:TRAP-type C4-dicarboxylate transport system permease large subunit